jgi:hypothetical protein
MTPMRITPLNYKPEHDMTPIDQWPPQRTPVVLPSVREAISTDDVDLTLAALDRAMQRMRSTMQEMDAILRLLRGQR